MRSMQKPLIKYRIKDRMGCVFYRTFNTDNQAYSWYERNKIMYEVKEFGRVGVVFKSKILDSLHNF